MAYLERYLEEFLTNIQGGDEPSKKAVLQQELRAVACWVHTLNINNINATLDLDLLVKYLPLLTSLSLTYGTKYAGMDYNKQANGMKLSEAANLGEAIKNSYSLVNSQPASGWMSDQFPCLSESSYH